MTTPAVLSGLIVSHEAMATSYKTDMNNLFGKGVKAAFKVIGAHACAHEAAANALRALQKEAEHE